MISLTNDYTDGARPPARNAAEAADARTGRVQIGHRSPADRVRLIDWLAEGLRPGRPGRLLAEYPTVLGQDSPAIPITAFHGSQPVAHATLLPRRAVARLGARRVCFDVGLISFVYCDPRFRGCGHARRVLEAVDQTATRHGLSLTMLWSDLDDFYSSLGFHEAGVEQLYTLPRLTLEAELKRFDAGRRLATSHARWRDWAKIRRWRAERRAGIQLDASELDRLVSLPDMDVIVATDSEEPTAFVAIGRGDDFKGIVHEWAGDPVGVLTACRDWLQRAPEFAALALLAPGDDSRLAPTLVEAGFAAVDQPMAWMKLTNRRAFRRSFLHAAPDRIADFDAAMQHASEATTLTELFGHARLAGSQAAAERGAPLLSFFVWGLESF